MKTLVIAAVSGLVLASAGTMTVMAGSAATTAGPGACTDGHYWTATGVNSGLNVEGRPIGYRAGDKEGLYVWHDCDGWHLRTTDPVLPDSNPVHIYSGVVTTTGRFSALKEFRLEPADQLTQTSLSSFQYAFRTYHFKDGVDWRTTGSTLTFDVSKSPDHNFIVYLGKEKAIPVSNVITFTLVDVGGASDESSSPASAASVTGSAVAAGDGKPHFSVAVAPRLHRLAALHLRPLNRRRA